MRFDWWTLALQTINFAVLVWLLHRFLYKPVLRLIDERKAALQKEYDAAKAFEDKSKAELARVDAERAGIAAERETALKAAAAQSLEAAEARRAQAEREARALVETARRSLAKERERALSELRRSALDLGAEFARRLLADVPVQLRAEAWIEQIEQHLKALPGTEIDSLVRQFTDGATLAVVTATPLPPQTAEAWRTRLRGALGEGVPITFAVDPDLVAGAELHFPTAILRFSWQSALASLRSEIEAHGDAH